MYFSNSHPSRLLPTPAGPDTRTNRGCRRSTDAWNSSRIMRISTPRPISGASSPSTRCAPPIAETTCVARHTRSGSTLPLSWCSPASSNLIALVVNRRVVAVDEHLAGRGDGLDARRGVHRIAGDHPLVRRPDRHGDLAGHHAGPRPEIVGAAFGTELADGVDEVQAGAHGTLGVLLGRHRSAPHGHHRIADELLDHSPVAPDDGSRRLEVPGQQLAHLFGVIDLRARREPDEIAEQHRAHASFGHRIGRRRAAEPGRWRWRSPRPPTRSRHRTACRPLARHRRWRSLAAASPRTRRRTACQRD